MNSVVTSLELMFQTERARAVLAPSAPPWRRGTHSLSPSAPGPELGLRLPLTLSAAVAAGLLRGPVPLLEDGPSPPDAPRFQERLL